MERQRRLAIITTHPIQYYAPVFKMLVERGKIDLKVFYTAGKASLHEKVDPGFGKVIRWDIPLLAGYEFEFVPNVSKKPGSQHFFGINNPTLPKLILDYAPDVVLIYGWSYLSHFQLIRFCRANRIKVIFRTDSILLQHRPTTLKKICRFIFLRWLYRNLTAIVYVGQLNRLYFKKAGVIDSRLFYAPHAIDNVRFGSDALQRTEAALSMRRSLGIQDDNIVFLFAGKLEAKKDVGTLLEAFKSCSFRDHAHLIIVGNGVYELQLKEKYGGEMHIHFLDFQNQSILPVIYRMGDVCVLPSKSTQETWGLFINEAMACARAVVVSDECGCAPELVESGKNGFIFQAGSVNDLINVIENLFKLGKARIGAMGSFSLKKIQDFSFDNVCNSLEDIIVQIDRLSVPTLFSTSVK